MQRTSKSMRRREVPSSTLSTSHGATRPQRTGEQRLNANAHANPIQPPAQHRAVGMWTSSNSTCPHAHRARLRPPVAIVAFHTKRRGLSPAEWTEAAGLAVNKLRIAVTDFEGPGTKLLDIPFSAPAIVEHQFSRGKAGRPVESVVSVSIAYRFCVGQVAAHLLRRRAEGGAISRWTGF